MVETPPSAPLPPLEWLRVFDAAARLGNFTAAAAALGLTQAAVSQRMRNLEAHLGVALFTRLPRGVELTTEGEAYAPHVRSALAALQRSTTDLFSAPRRRLSIAATASTIELWIAPRLPALLQRLPDLQVSLATVQRVADYAAASADFEVRFGDGAWPDRQARKLYDEVLAPVVAPGLLDEAEADWRRLPQIATAGPRHGARARAAFRHLRSGAERGAGRRRRAARLAGLDRTRGRGRIAGPLAGTRRAHGERLLVDLARRRCRLQGPHRHPGRALRSGGAGDGARADGKRLDGNRI